MCPRRRGQGLVPRLVTARTGRHCPCPEASAHEAISACPRHRESHGSESAGRTSRREEGARATAPRCAAGGRAHGGLGLVCSKAGLAWAPPLTLCAAGHRMPRQASGRGADRPAGPQVSTTQTGGCTFPAKGAGLLGPRRSPGGSACGLSPDAGRLPPPQRTTLTGDRHRTVPEVTLRSHGPFRAMRVSRRIRTRQAAGLSGLLRRIFSL